MHRRAWAGRKTMISRWSKILTYHPRWTRPLALHPNRERRINTVFEIQLDNRHITMIILIINKIAGGRAARVGQVPRLRFLVSAVTRHRRPFVPGRQALSSLLKHFGATGV